MLKKIALFASIFICMLQPNFAQEANQSMTQEPNKHPVVVFETTAGVIKLELTPEVAPKTCENFIGLVKKHYYDGVIFHRIIKDFMIQGGDPTGTGRGGDSFFGGKFKDEFSNKTFAGPGILAMANAGPNTNGSQFFITTAATPWLNNKHTIFGHITSDSSTVLKALNATKTLPGDRPEKEVKIIKAYMQE